jgi:hypothetical protein
MQRNGAKAAAATKTLAEPESYSDQDLFSER